MTIPADPTRPWWDHFETVFAFKPDHVYDAKTVELIRRNRQTLEGELFFDKLVLVLDVSASMWPMMSTSLPRSATS